MFLIFKLFRDRQIRSPSQKRVSTSRTLSICSLVTALCFRDRPSLIVAGIIPGFMLSRKRIIFWLSALLVLNTRYLLA